MRMPKPPSSKTFNYVQHVSRNCLKPKQQKTGDFGRAPESALGPGGRAFNSPRPDQSLILSIVLASNKHRGRPDTSLEQRRPGSFA
jgi:hypothetical protein